MWAVGCILAELLLRVGDLCKTVAVFFFMFWFSLKVDLSQSMIVLFCLCSPKVPFLPGSSDLDQLSKIFETLGTPSEDSWPVSNASIPVRMLTSKQCYILIIGMTQPVRRIFF